MILYMLADAAADESLAALTEEIQENLEQLKPNVLLETIKGWGPHLIAFGLKILFALLIFFIGSRIIKIIRSIMERSFKKMDMEVSVRKFLLSVFNALLYCVLVFTIAVQIGVNSASIVALFGSASIAIGLAVQGSLANFAGGVLILLMKPFRVGEGTVRTIGLVYTVLNTADNKQVVIPNGTLSNSALTNVTAMDKRRLDVLVRISYGSDLIKAKKIIEEVIKNHIGIIQEDPMEVFVSDLTDQSVIIGGRGWTLRENYWTVRGDILEQIKLRLEEEGIELSFHPLTGYGRESL
jgi:small conductance mechanosensitive channel